MTEKLYRIMLESLQREMDQYRITAERIEEFEQCANLRDNIKEISDYLLGYRETRPDENVLDFLLTYGDVVEVDGQDITFSCTSGFWTFTNKDVKI